MRCYDSHTSILTTVHCPFHAHPLLSLCPSINASQLQLFVFIPLSPKSILVHCVHHIHGVDLSYRWIFLLVFTAQIIYIYIT